MPDVTAVIKAARSNAMFLAAPDLEILAGDPIWRLTPVQVRLQDGPRFTATALDVADLVRVMETAGYTVRDRSLCGPPPVTDVDDLVAVDAIWWAAEAGVDGGPDA